MEEPLDEGDAQLPNKDGQVDLSHSPTVERMRSLLSDDRSEEEFELALETLLDRLEMAFCQWGRLWRSAMRVASAHGPIRRRHVS